MTDNASVMYHTPCRACGKNAVELLRGAKVARCRACGGVWHVNLGFKMDAPDHPVRDASEHYGQPTPRKELSPMTTSPLISPMTSPTATPPENTTTGSTVTGFKFMEPQPVSFYHEHRTARGEPTMNVKLEKNSKGFNYECTVMGARTALEADELMRNLRERVEAIIDGEARPAVRHHDESEAL